MSQMHQQNIYLPCLYKNKKSPLKRQPLEEGFGTPINFKGPWDTPGELNTSHISITFQYV